MLFIYLPSVDASDICICISQTITFLNVRMYSIIHMIYGHVTKHSCLSCSCMLCVGKVLIIGGGIANFTNVAATFKVRTVLFNFMYKTCISVIQLDR